MEKRNMSPLGCDLQLHLSERQLLNRLFLHLRFWDVLAQFIRLMLFFKMHLAVFKCPKFPVQ